MSQLRSMIESLASQFAESIIEALRSASIDELLDVAGGPRGTRPRRAELGTAAAPARRGRGGRLGRRNANDIAQMVDRIVALLQKNGGGLRAEQIRDELAVDARELPRPLADALAAGRISKTGQKRATTYFAGGEAGGAPKRRGKRPARKRG